MQMLNVTANAEMHASASTRFPVKKKKKVAVGLKTHN